MLFIDGDPCTLDWRRTGGKVNILMGDLGNLTCNFTLSTNFKVEGLEHCLLKILKHWLGSSLTVPGEPILV